MTTFNKTAKRNIAVQSKTDRSYCPCTHAVVDTPVSVENAQVESAIDFSYAVRY